MTIELTNDEKLNIVNQHIKSVDYSLYGSQLDLVEIQATANPDAAQVSTINDRITAATARRAALVEERDSLTTNSAEQQIIMADKAELVILALQQRIGEIVSNYETQLAILRADYTKALEQLENTKKEKDAKFEAAEAYSEQLDNITD